MIAARRCAAFLKRNIEIGRRTSKVHGVASFDARVIIISGEMIASLPTSPLLDRTQDDAGKKNSQVRQNKWSTN